MLRCTRSLGLGLLAALTLLPWRGGEAATCGSVLLYERLGPAVLQGIPLGGATVVRIWEAGSGGTNYISSPCTVGCASLTAAPGCSGASECIAVIGLNWLNGGVCSAAGRRPARTVILVERTTAAAGGVWAAINVEKNAQDANVDVDARAGAACGAGCASVASPYVGGDQTIVVTSAVVASGTLTMTITWTAPPSVAEAVNTSETSLVKSYGVFYRRAPQASPPAATGDKAGWTRVNDTDGSQIGGYSLNTSATVAVALGGSADDVYLAIAPNFDGDGNPDTDPNCMRSQYLSKPVLAYRPGGTVPTVRAIRPPYGATAGGNLVVVHGGGFETGTGVYLGGAEASSVVIDGSGELHATTPAHAAGKVDLVVVKPQGLSATLTQAFTYTNLPATSMDADQHAASGTTGDLNGVLEPGEHVVLEPAVTNYSGAAVSATGTAVAFTGPSGATYTLHDSSASYGTVAAGDEQSCHEAGGNCYRVSVSAPASRPATHWDATLTEQLSSGEIWQRTVHIGASFTDVPRSHWAYRLIETMLHNGVTAGCGVGIYCPDGVLTRAQMAVFLLMAKHGPAYVPPLSTGTVFTDVPINHWAGDYIEQLVVEGITSGCGVGIFCPDNPITRAEMAVFLLMAEHGPTYVPPLSTGTVFSDVPIDHWAGDFIEQLAAEGIASGCAPSLYCPEGIVTRAEMAVFLSATFNLKLYD